MTRRLTLTCVTVVLTEQGPFFLVSLSSSMLSIAIHNLVQPIRDEGVNDFVTVEHWLVFLVPLVALLRDTNMFRAKGYWMADVVMLGTAALLVEADARWQQTLRQERQAAARETAEARRQLLFFCNSLRHIALKKPPPVNHMRTVSTLTPYYNEVRRAGVGVAGLAAGHGRSPAAPRGPCAPPPCRYRHQAQKSALLEPPLLNVLDLVLRSVVRMTQEYNCFGVVGR